MIESIEIYVRLNHCVDVATWKIVNKDVRESVNIASLNWVCFPTRASAKKFEVKHVSIRATGQFNEDLNNFCHWDWELIGQLK